MVQSLGRSATARYGAEWCYFTALEGTKPYGPGINCCVSSEDFAVRALEDWARGHRPWIESVFDDDGAMSTG